MNLGLARLVVTAAIVVLVICGREPIGFGSELSFFSQLYSGFHLEPKLPDVKRY